MDPEDKSSDDKVDLGDPAAQVLDFGCYVTIKNDSKRDLLLDTFGIVGGFGEWPLGQPVNTIAAWTSETIHLKDKPGPAGSEGWVRYEVRVNKKTESIRISFDCPYPFWKDNRVTYYTSTEAISVDVGWYDNKGHPLRCTVTVTLNENATLETNPIVAKKVNSYAAANIAGDKSVRANYELGFHSRLDPFGVLQTSPVHENIAIAAFINSELPLPKGTVPNNLSAEQWEYFRGLLWPDDPRCLLFNDSQEDNRIYSNGVDWAMEYKFGQQHTLTRRSHFGDLQFLHSMGSTVGEAPQVTRDKLLQWMGIMYRLALGQDGVSENDSVTKHFPESVFGPEWGSSSLRALLLSTTPSYDRANVRRRALGVCLHIIQDSYAVGHVRRQLRNPEDLLGPDGNGYMHFLPGKYGDLGDIVCFHTYKGQSELRHKHYDKMPQGHNDVSPRDPETFNNIIGARCAIKGCQTLIDLYADDVPWEKVKTTLEEGIYKLHPNAKPSDVNVDSLEWRTPPPMNRVNDMKEVDNDHDVEYWAGHERKLRDLGMSAASSLRPKSRMTGFSLTLTLALGLILSAFGAYITFRLTR